MRRAAPFWAKVMSGLAVCLALWAGGPAPAVSADKAPADAASAGKGGQDAFFDDLYQEAQTGAVQVYDPLEPVNRVFFQFNDRFYFWVAKPAARGYRAVVPTEIRTCIKNFFYNLLAPIRIVNCLLQGKGGSAGNELLRLTINTTAGLGGLADVADRYPELKSADEDFGQTLGVWGVGNGFYLVIPFLGPSTARDGLASVGDQYLSPVNWAVDSFGDGVAVFAFRHLNSVSFRIGDYEALKAAALDPYAAFRDGYVQSRDSKIRK